MVSKRVLCMSPAQRLCQFVSLEKGIEVYEHEKITTLEREIRSIRPNMDLEPLQMAGYSRVEYTRKLEEIYNKIYLELKVSSE